jgi:S1-C subfamily serine protease
MVQRALVLLAIGSLLGVLFATWLGPRPANGEDAPRELRAAPAQPSARTRDLSVPFVEATRKVRAAVAKIVNYQQGWRGQLVPAGSGSGVLVSREGHILTNRHVIEGAVELEIGLPDGRTFRKARVLGADPRSDVAVVKLDGAEDLPIATLGDSDSLQAGEWVIAIGAPFNLDSSVSAGIVSATGRTGVLGTRADSSEEFIQTDAALNPGNSGGPLINLDGQVVGINTAIQTGGMSAVNAGVGFAIPINLARTIAVSLIEKGVAQRGWLGIEPEPVGYEDLARLGVEARGAIRARHVDKGSPAERAGMRKGDILISVDGRPTADADALKARLAAAGPGGAVEVAFLQDGREKKAKVVLAEEPFYTFGLEVQTLDDTMTDRVGLPRGTRGAVVTEVKPGSPAIEEGGTQLIFPGDVVVAIAVGRSRVNVASREQFTDVMQQIQGRRIPVRFILLVKDRLYQVTLQRSDRG